MKTKIELPYIIGMNFYIILIVFVLTFIGCKTFEKYEEKENKMSKKSLTTKN